MKSIYNLIDYDLNRLYVYCSQLIILCDIDSHHASHEAYELTYYV